MEKYVMLMDPNCEGCRQKMYVEQQEKKDKDDRVISTALTLKCTNEECKFFNKPFLIPKLKLAPYV